MHMLYFVFSFALFSAYFEKYLNQYSESSDEAVWTHVTAILLSNNNSSYSFETIVLVLFD